MWGGAIPRSVRGINGASSTKYQASGEGGTMGNRYGIDEKSPRDGG
jgi:hypothetical protein